MMIMSFFLSVLATVFWCLGLRAVSDTGKLLYPARLWVMDSKMPDYVAKPLLLCVTCTASLWGQVMYWSVSLSLCDFSPLMVPCSVLCCVGSSYVNELLWGHLELQRLRIKSLSR